MNNFARRLKLSMKMRNKRQADVTSETSINKGALNSYLSGDYEPRPDKLRVLANYFGVNYNWLIGENEAIFPLPEYNFFKSNFIVYKKPVIQNICGYDIPFATASISTYPCENTMFYTRGYSEKNELHIVENFYYCRDRVYDPIKDLTTPYHHRFFTLDLDHIDIEYQKSTIYYYGLDYDTLEPIITIYKFDNTNNCYNEVEFIRDLQKPELIIEFTKEIFKQSYFMMYVSEDPQKEGELFTNRKE